MSGLSDNDIELLDTFEGDVSILVNSVFTSYLLLTVTSELF